MLHSTIKDVKYYKRKEKDTLFYDEFDIFLINGDGMGYVLNDHKE